VIRKSLKSKRGVQQRMNDMTTAKKKKKEKLKISNLQIERNTQRRRRHNAKHVSNE